MEQVLTVAQFANHLKIEPVTVYKAVRDGRLSCIRILGRIAIPKTELKRLKKRRNGDKTWILRAR